MLIPSDVKKSFPICSVRLKQDGRTMVVNHARNTTYISHRNIIEPCISAGRYGNLMRSWYETLLAYIPNP